MQFNRRNSIVAATALGLATLSVLAYRATLADLSLTDFWTFWNVGNAFTAGVPLYAPSAAYREFYYPPFAAMLFTLLNSLPLQVSQALFNVASLWAWVGSLTYLYWEAPESSPTRSWSLFIAAVVTLPFLLNTLHMVQVNGFLLALMIVGFDLVRRDRPWSGGTLLGIATLVKVVPFGIVLWLAARGKFKPVLAASVAILLGCLMTVVVRGPHRALWDHRDFVSTVVRPATTAGYRAEIFNFSLGSAIARMNSSSRKITGAASLRMSLIVRAVLIVGLAWTARTLRMRTALANDELSLVIVAILLLSPHTATSHLLWLSPVVFSISANTCRTAGSPWRLGLFTVVIFGLVIAQPYLIGRPAWLWLAEHSVWTIWLLILAAISWVGLAGATRDPWRAETPSNRTVNSTDVGSADSNGLVIPIATRVAHLAR